MPTVRDIEAVQDDAIAFVKIVRRNVNYGYGTEESQCTNKKPFAEFKIASTAAGRRKKRQVYRCRYCRSWHVGTKG